MSIPDDEVSDPEYWNSIQGMCEAHAKEFPDIDIDGISEEELIEMQQEMYEIQNEINNMNF